MKRAAIAFAGMLLSAGLMACGAAARTGLYPRSGIVTGIDRDADVVTFTDGAGNAWSFYGTEDWMIGDHVAGIMDDNGTASIYDDVIVSVQYAG